MKVAIKVLLFLFIFPLHSFAKCQLAKPVISLSGPMTMLLEEVGLIKDPNLRAISRFHPIKEKFTGEVLAGGLFLSPKVFHRYKDAIIIFDKSREFKYLLKKSEHKYFIEIDSRDQDPFEVVNLLILKLREITKGCRQQIKTLDKKMKTIHADLKKSKAQLKAVFFLGRFTSKTPDMLISNDGFVMLLKRLNVLKTYPSDLAYVSWAEKELSRLKDYVFYGIGTDGKDELQIHDVAANKKNIYFRGILIPGIRQVYFTQQFLKLSLTSER